jgi:predicted nucleic acid-binding protein
LPAWAELREVQTDLTTIALDRGESEAITLAKENPNSILLIDEKEGRAVAENLGIKVIGTLGVLELAGIKRIIDFPMSIERLRKTNIFLSEDLIKSALGRSKASE